MKLERFEVGAGLCWYDSIEKDEIEFIVTEVDRTNQTITIETREAFNERTKTKHARRKNEHTTARSKSRPK